MSWRALARRARWRLLRPGRPPGLRTAKTTLAAVLSFVVAEQLHTSPSPILAPLTALLVVQLTMYETVAHGIGRIASVIAGVLVAVGVAQFVGLTWWSLGLVIVVSLLLGRLLRLGPNLLEVPISAMLVLAVGGADTAAFGRVYETLIGAGCGIAVNFVIAPPLYIQPAGDALHELATRMARFLSELGGDLRTGWSRDAADRWLNEARALGGEVARADTALARAEESVRLNPRSGAVRGAPPRFRTSLSGLEHCYVSVRSLCRSLLDRTFFLPDDRAGDAYSQEIRDALADVLDVAASAVLSVGVATAELTPLAAVQAQVGQQVAELHRRTDVLAALLVVEQRADQAAWQQHGALLAAVDRLRVEVEGAVGGPPP